RTPRWLAPRNPPPLSTSPMRTRDVASSMPSRTVRAVDAPGWVNATGANCAISVWNCGDNSAPGCLTAAKPAVFLLTADLRLLFIVAGDRVPRHPERRCDGPCQA